ncbi:MAG: hypothetical protein QW407_02750 [Thermofilaceae archaeon]
MDRQPAYQELAGRAARERLEAGLHMYEHGLWVRVNWSRCWGCVQHCYKTVVVVESGKHERLVSELKGKGIPITRRIAAELYPKTYEVHFTAVEYELAYTLSKGDREWVKRRLAHFEDWLKDPNLPQELAPRFKSLKEKLQGIFSSCQLRFDFFS